MKLAATLRTALRRPLLRLAEKVLAKAGFPTNGSGNNMSSR